MVTVSTERGVNSTGEGRWLLHKINAVMLQERGPALGFAHDRK